MGQFTQFIDVNFCYVSDISILSVSLVEASRSPIGIIQVGGRSSMQALILFSRNIGGIRRNPEGENGAFPAPRPCDMRKLAHTLPTPEGPWRSGFEHAANVTQAIGGD